MVLRAKKNVIQHTPPPKKKKKTHYLEDCFSKYWRSVSQVTPSNRKDIVKYCKINNGRSESTNRKYL